MIFIETRMVEITMIFHILKNPQKYQEEMMQNPEKTFTNWALTVKKMRDNLLICNYKFLRDMTKNARDTSWIITGLNHWSPNEYLKQQQQIVLRSSSFVNILSLENMFF